MYVHARKHRYIHTHVVEWYNVAKPIECLKLQVISNKRATHYRALLRKMTHKDEASYGSLPPYDYSLCVRLIPLHDMYTHILDMYTPLHDMYTHIHKHTPEW